jgi:hypothetical protein
MPDINIERRRRVPAGDPVATIYLQHRRPGEGQDPLPQLFVVA